MTSQRMGGDGEGYPGTSLGMGVRLEMSPSPSFPSFLFSFLSFFLPLSLLPVFPFFLVCFLLSSFQNLFLNCSSTGL